MKKSLVLLWIAFFVLGLCGLNSAHAQLILTFEDLYPGYETADFLPSNYMGFTWDPNSAWITKNFWPGSGYDYGTIGNVSLFTNWAADISYSNGTFSLYDAYITAAWNSGQDVTVEGWRSGSLVYSNTIITSWDGPYHWDFNFRNVDQVWFKPGDLGTNAGLGGWGEFIAIDNINMVPEPATILLLASGLLGLGVVARFRRKKKS